jgi:hypothetical protein
MRTANVEAEIKGIQMGETWYLTESSTTELANVSETFDARTTTGKMQNGGTQEGNITNIGM